MAFILVFSLFSYVLYWFLLLPQNFSDDQEFMSLSFQNMNFFYPIVYIGYQSLFILTISILFIQRYSIYIILFLQIVYLFFLICKQPYNTLRRLNKTLHNATIIFNHFLTIFMTLLIIRWNSIVGSSYQILSSSEITAYAFLIGFMMIISLIMTILRLVIFNKEITFKCCKK